MEVLGDFPKETWNLTANQGFCEEETDRAYNSKECPKYLDLIKDKSQPGVLISCVYSNQYMGY